MNITSLIKSRGIHHPVKEKPATPTPLCLPEILSAIFSFLSQYSLTYTVRFVCKRWLAVARPLIRTTMLWNYWFHPDNIRKLLNHLHKVTDLNINFIRFYGIHYIMPPWKLLSQKVDSLLASNQLHVSSLVLTGSNYSTQLIYPLLPKLTNLSDIRMVSMEKGTIHLGVIIQLCLKLRSICIEQPQGTNHIEDDTPTPWHESAPGFRESKMENLIINSMHAKQESLEAIIKRCPQLRTLKLSNVILQEPEAALFDRKKFYGAVAMSCPQLRYFHLSISQQHMTLEHAEAFHRTFFPETQSSIATAEFGYEDDTYYQYQQSNLDTISVQDIDINQDTTPFILAPLLDPYLSNMVTTLEIFNTGGEPFSVYLSNLLHNFLCSASSLLHLLAPDVNYYAEYFDLCGPSAGNGYYYPRSCVLWPVANKSHRLKKQIWACRRLRTLQIKVTSKDLVDCPSAENGRIMFGYISTVCPVLRELVIERGQLHLGPDGGFCFLSRLCHLGKLTVSTKTLTVLDKRDLEWMSLKPIVNFGSWTRTRLRIESRIHVFPTIPSSELTPTDLEDIGSVANLDSCRGQLALGMGEKGCWPILEFLSLNFRLLHKGKSVKVEDYLPTIMAEIRPGVELQCKTTGV